jgi:hypothetical protein
VAPVLVVRVVALVLVVRVVAAALVAVEVVVAPVLVVRVVVLVLVARVVALVLVVLVVAVALVGVPLVGVVLVRVPLVGLALAGFQAVVVFQPSCDVALAKPTKPQRVTRRKRRRRSAPPDHKGPRKSRWLTCRRGCKLMRLALRRFPFALVLERRSWTGLRRLADAVDCPLLQVVTSVYRW